MELDGKVAVVTGAARETGRTIALRLGAEGAMVVVADRDAEHGERTAETIRACGGRARFAQTDVTDDDALATLIGGARLRILVNNTGGWGAANYPEATPAQWTAGIATTAYASPEYGAAKAGLIRFTTSLADLPGVRVNCVVPDWIRTERAEGELARMTDAERAAAPEPIPMEAVAEAVVALAADDSLAGRVLVLRGGEPPRFLP